MRVCVEGFPCGTSMWKEVRHIRLLCVWEAFHLFICLYSRMFSVVVYVQGVGPGVCIHVKEGRQDEAGELSRSPFQSN